MQNYFSLDVECKIALYGKPLVLRVVPITARQ